MDSLFGLIGEAVWNKLNSKKDKGGMASPPGFTRTQMMTNQGPMGTPTQDPAQFSGPYYATPYGGTSFVNEADTQNPLSTQYTRSLRGVAGELGQRNAPGNYSNPYTLNYNYDTILGPREDHGSSTDALDYGQRVNRETAMQILLDAARQQAIEDSTRSWGR
jgi:hypothetical protein